MQITTTDRIKASILEQLNTGSKQTCGALKAVAVPEVITHINKALEDPSVSTADVVRLVHADPVLTTKILQVANSPLLCRAQVITIKDAVGQLGLSLVRNIAVYVSLHETLKTNNAALRQKLHELTLTSAHVAATMYVLCKVFTQLNPDVATLIGLIHNIGAMAVVNYIEEHSNEYNITDINIDDVIADVSRQVGSCILYKWGIPTPVVDVVVNTSNTTHADITDLRTYRHVFGAAKQYVAGSAPQLMKETIDSAMESYAKEVEDFLHTFGY